VRSNAERAETLVRVIRAAVGDGDTDVCELLTDDVRAWTPGLAAASRDELLDHFARRDDALSDVDVETIALDVGSQFACVEWSVSMTHTGPLVLPGGAIVEATGLRVTLHGVAVAEFDGDRICALRQYWDELSLFEQLGLIGQRA
jgi:hypothetical protein